MLIPQLLPHAGHSKHANGISIGAFHQEGYSSAVHVVKRAFETVVRRLALLGLIHPSAFHDGRRIFGCSSSALECILGLVQ